RRARAHHLRQPALGSAVRHGARRKHPRRYARNRVVTPELAGAYAYCERLARSHYENFPVASRLLPAPMRPHIAAVYAFARIADDIADEGTAPAAERLARLDAWQRRLHAALSIDAKDHLPHAHEDLIIAATAHSIRAL